MSQAKNSNLVRLILALLSGFLLWLAWPPLPTAFLIFIALTPLLAIFDQVNLTSKNPGYRLVLFSYLLFFAWNALTTWWIWLASPEGAAMAIILNALLMTLPVYFSWRVRRYFGRATGYAALICFWILFEYIHFNWDAPWPWLTLGNVFAGLTDWVQWYEFTGALGGTLWVWLINILLYEAVLKHFFNRLYMAPAENVSVLIRKKLLVAAAVLLLVPVLFSYIIKPADVELNDSKNIVVVQPNIDPYLTKFNQNTFAEQINTLIKLSESKVDSNTVAVVWPETAIAEEVEEEKLLFYPNVNTVHEFLHRHPQVKLVTGTSSYNIYPYSDEKKPTETARAFKNKSAYFDIFNSALLLDTSNKFSFYHKSKLVPGVEKMPYPGIFGFLEALIIDLGGSSGSLGSQDSAAVFRLYDNVITAPIICYESVFGEYVSEFVNKGANVITIITNDGWWGNTPGYKQHMLYARLRAIETRRFIARSANTGISCYILPNGKILQPQGWWVQSVIKSPIYTSAEKSFYVKYGDYIGRIAKWLSYLFLIIAFTGKWLIRLFPNQRTIFN